MIRIITGATGTAHVTSADDGAINCGMMGDTSGVLKAGAKLEATIVDNNTIRISDGDIMMQGRVGRVEPNTTEDMTISTGTVGTYRKDLIVVRYQMDNNTGYESMNLVVIEGTETSGTATDPAYNEGVIRTGASIVDMPLYRVNLDGINITGIDKLFIELDNIGSFKAAVDEVQEEVATLSDQLKSNDGLVFQLANDDNGNYGMLDKEGNFMAFGGNNGVKIEYMVLGVRSEAGITKDMFYQNCEGKKTLKIGVLTGITTGGASETRWSIYADGVLLKTGDRYANLTNLEYDITGHSKIYIKATVATTSGTYWQGIIVENLEIS